MGDAITLICTAGTSLFNKFRNIDIDDDKLTPSRKESKKHLADNNLIGFSKSLLKEKQGDEILGAEICSIHHIIQSTRTGSPANIIFLVSDTEEGRATGEALSRYFNDSGYNIQGEKKFATYEIIEKLDDRNPWEFKNTGLRNLIKKISGKVQALGRENVIINATGGYKAQILFAGVLGQSLGIPVYYLFEKFNEIIELPPQPVSFDPDFWLENQNIFFALARTGYVGKEFSENWFNSKDPRFETLITAEKENDSLWLMLSPTGEIFHQMFRLKYLSDNVQLPVKSDIKDKPLIGEHHMPEGIKHYLTKITEKYPFIIRCITISLGKKAPEKLFRLSSNNNKEEITGSYYNGFAVNFVIHTTAKNREEMIKAVVHMNDTWDI
jgi:putative CRISPR-associated protein (TIGR02619 family)